VIDAHPSVTQFAEAVLNCLGFEDSKGSNGTLVQMQDDVYLKSGIKDLITRLKSLIEVGGIIDEAVRTRLAKEEEERIANNPKAESSDDEGEYRPQTRDYPNPNPVGEVRDQDFYDREARFRAISSKEVTHERHGRSFIARNEFDHDANTFTAVPAHGDRSERQRSMHVTLDGKARVTPIPDIYAPGASSVVNSKYLEREMAAKRAIKTSSTTLNTINDATATFADFALHPAQVLCPFVSSCVYRSLFDFVSLFV
jgi:hypothetical protein